MSQFTDFIEQISIQCSTMCSSSMLQLDSEDKNQMISVFESEIEDITEVKQLNLIESKMKQAIKLDRAIFKTTDIYLALLQTLKEVCFEKRKALYIQELSKELGWDDQKTKEIKKKTLDFIDTFIIDEIEKEHAIIILTDLLKRI